MQVADDIGFPLMIKATAGGGGRGMRLAERKEDFLKLLRAAQQEAEAAFGNGACYIERYVVNPRHIEFQARAPPVATPCGGFQACQWLYRSGGEKDKQKKRKKELDVRAGDCGQARQRGAPRRARLLHPAPQPEAGRGGAQSRPHARGTRASHMPDPLSPRLVG